MHFLAFVRKDLFEGLKVENMQICVKTKNMF